MKEKYVLTALFYLIASLIVYAFVKLSPDADDGTPGLGSNIFLFFITMITLLVIINFIKGIIIKKDFYIIAAIHTAAIILIYLFVFR
ncbi:hypothetical protein [Niabella soli]|uniref:Uncharacterized protein n=1 Tax=Niabella soli DSM 19437 TaxID=929713 RepID=W0F610_9BACT|nr:hypothetical protein [Niabella soli]AHF17238.1 hypothetical protein NIASO_04330 [Niabella soli DSM 19437]